MLITQICADELVLLSSAAFFLAAPQKEVGFKGHSHPSSTLSLAASEEKSPQEVLTLMLWRLQKELKLEDNVFSTAVKRN